MAAHQQPLMQQNPKGMADSGKVDLVDDRYKRLTSERKLGVGFCFLVFPL